MGHWDPQGASSLHPLFFQIYFPNSPIVLLQSGNTSSQAEQEFLLQNHTLISLCLCLRVKLHVSVLQDLLYLQENPRNREISFVSMVNGVDSLPTSCLPGPPLENTSVFIWNPPCSHIAHALQEKWTPTSPPGEVLAGVMESHTFATVMVQKSRPQHQLRAYP